MKAAIAHVCKGVVPSFSQVKNDDFYLSVFHETEEAAAFRSSRYKAKYAKWKTLERRRQQHPNAVQWPVRLDADQPYSITGKFFTLV